MKHSTKLMWGCVTIVVMVMGQSIAGANTGYALFALPCIVMGAPWAG